MTAFRVSTIGFLACLSALVVIITSSAIDTSVAAPIDIAGQCLGIACSARQAQYSN